MLRHSLSLALKSRPLFGGRTGNVVAQAEKNWRYDSGRRFRSRAKKSWSLGGPDYELPLSGKVKHKSYRRELLIVGGILMAAGVAYYYSAPIVEVPFTGRKYRRLIPKPVSNWLELAIIDELLAENEESILPEDHPLVRQIKSIGDVLTDANGLPRHDYILVDSDEVNAFVVGGNTVFVYTGIMPIFQNVSGAAMVLGHEMGHVLAGHPVEGMSQALGTIAVSLALSIFGTGNELAMDVFDLLFRLPRARGAELEADAIGYALMTRAGFDRDEAVNVYERMMIATGDEDEDEGDDWDQTHPIWATRIGLLQELLETDPSDHGKWVRLPATPPKSSDSSWDEQEDDGSMFYVWDDEDDEDDDYDDYDDDDDDDDDERTKKKRYSPYNIFGRAGAERANQLRKKLRRRVRMAQKQNQDSGVPLATDVALLSETPSKSTSSSLASALRPYTIVSRISADRAKALRRKLRARIRRAQFNNL